MTGISAVTMTSALPIAVTQGFRILVEAMIDQFDLAVEPIRTRLGDRPRQSNPDAVLAGAGPTVRTRAADDVEPRSMRTRYPTRQNLFWDQNASGTE